MFKIAITGPESTGKSKISQELASNFACKWVPEFAREYLEARKGIYQEEDLLLILKGQLEAEKKAEKELNDFLICDTDPLVIKIWSEVKYGRIDSEIEEAWKKHHYDLYLLMYPDIAWTDDPLRESKEIRMTLFDLYQKELEKLNRPYIVIKGKGEERKSNSLKAINYFFTRP